MIYITSDFHFSHNKDFIYQARGFSSIDEMNEVLVERFNRLVQPQDQVYILGDIMLGGAQAYQENLKFMNALNGELYLIRGNHDTDSRWNSYAKDISSIKGMDNSLYLNYKKFHFYLSHYPSITSNHDYDKPLQQRIINLCGHTHTTNPWQDYDKGYIYHCEVDAHMGHPVPLDKIIEEFFWTKVV